MANHQWVLVTGGSRGIGLALVTELRRHWNVVFTGRNADGVNETQAALENFHLETWVKGVPCDGKNEEQVAALASSLLDKHGAPAAIIHNAGITRDALHIHQNAEIWRDVLDNNVVSIMNWHQKLLPSMLMAGHGSIVLMSSITGLKGNIGQTAYAASKSAMMGLTRSLAHEVGRFGLRVNCIAPGLIDSDMTRAMPEPKLKSMCQSIPLRRLGQPDEVAKLAEFLIGENSQYLTGQTLVLDGGLTA